jgi:hypothetical protein
MTKKHERCPFCGSKADLWLREESTAGKIIKVMAIIYCVRCYSQTSPQDKISDAWRNWDRRMSGEKEKKNDK